MRIIIPGADFSARNLGNVTFSRSVLQKMGIPAGATFNAFKTFLEAFEAAGFREDFDRAYLFGGATAAADKVDIISMLDANALSFPNDSPNYHTIDGLVLSESGNFNPNTQYVLNNLQPFHLHSYTNSAESATGDTPCLLGMRNVTGGNDFAAYLSLKGNTATMWRPITVIGTGNSISSREDVAIATSYSGLVSGFRVGTTVNICRDGLVKKTTANQVDATVLPSFNAYFGIGGYGLSSTSNANKSGARQRFAGWGHGAWTADKELKLKTMLDALESGI